ncbi:protein of unknown function [Pedobacter westerhofensis]|uniref:DUF4397 domain-containing protein n=1 Tax=Pedobacter westerhofensis TaxID=425512 RepID=A0A521FNG5_9SPHI|nr:DUF4397 domain-containing protein [Pedobacter westerhofensis]SMO97674.1 protein of unknown function [Pedobacter westerhofensis]
MKFNLTLFSEKPGKVYILAAMSYVAICLSSCKHDDEVIIPNQAAFSVTNASPTRPSVDFYLDNQKVNNSTVGSSTALNYGNSTGYWLAVTGTRTGKVTVSGNTTSILTQKIDLENDRYHSIFIVNSADTLSFLRIRDDWSASTPDGKAQVRFINLSPDAPAYSLEYSGDTTAFTNRAYKEYTGFKPVTAKTGITLNLRNTATNEIVSTLTDVKLDSKEIYTVWARGLVSAQPADTAKRIKITRLIRNFR